MGPKLDKLRDWMLCRLQESTTWAGLITAISVLIGMNIIPEKAESIAVIGSFVASAVAVFFPQK